MEREGGVRVRVLELMDISGDEPVALDDMIMLDQNEKLTYKGTRARDIISRFLNDHEPSEVFDKMANWSDGYVQLREREQSGL
jgi:hypothetical protein